MDVCLSPMQSPNTPSTPSLSESVSPSSSNDHNTLEQLPEPFLVDLSRRASSSAVMTAPLKRHSIHWEALDPSSSSPPPASPSSGQQTPIVGTRLPALQRSSSDRESNRLSRPRGSYQPSSRSTTRYHHFPSSSSSRPSSVASCSSAGESSSHLIKFGVNPSLLSPSLASALGIGVEGRKHSGSLFSSSRSSSTTSLVGLVTSSPSAHLRNPRRSVIGTKTSSSTLAGALVSTSTGSNSSTSNNFRRPSLPNVGLSHNRMSAASISSFESLPEGEPLSIFPPPTTGDCDKGEEPVSRTDVSVSPEPPSLMLPPSIRPAHTRNSATDPPSIVPPDGVCSTEPLSLVMKKAELESTASVLFPSHTASSSISSASTSSTYSRRRALHRSQTEPSAAFPTVSHEESMRKRGLVARELLTTEQAFLNSLRVLHEAFYQPLLARCGGNRGSTGLETGPVILSRKAINEIFSNFVDILQLNRELLGQLEERIGGKVRLDRAHTMASMRKAVSPVVESEANAKSAVAVIESGDSITLPYPIKEREPSEATATLPSSSTARFPWNPETDTVGDILVPIAPFLKMYSLYVKNFSSAIARIESERRENEAFAKFLKETERSTWGRGKAFFGLGLQAHLLTIVQRIPRYKLLVGDLLKHTPPNHRDSGDLRRAFEMIEQVASTINENVRQHEMVMLMLALQRSLTGLTSPLLVPGRTLLKRGTLRKACRKDIQPRAFFLFTDCIIYARPMSGGAGSIEAAWNGIARAGGFSAAGLSAGVGGPWSTQSAAASPRQISIPLDGTADTQGGRVRVSSGNLFSGNGIFEALQAQHQQQLQFREKYALQDCTVIGIEEASSNAHAHAHHSSTNAPVSMETGGTPYSFEIRTPDKSFAVYAETAESREAWVTAIREARNEWLKARRTLRAEEDSIEAKRDRRRSVTAAAAAKARQSIYSLSNPANSFHATIPEGTESVEVLFEGDMSQISVQAENEAASQPSSTPLSAASLKPQQPALAPGLPTSASFAALLGGGAPNSNTTPLRVLEDYNAPAWVPDSRADRCMSCSEAFGVWRRKHHCRLCGRVVCWSCSTKKFLIASYDEGKEDVIARACDTCYESTFPPESPGETPDLSQELMRIEEQTERDSSGDRGSRPQSWSETRMEVPSSKDQESFDPDCSESVGDETMTTGGPGARRSSEKLSSEGEEQGEGVSTSLLLAPLRALAADRAAAGLQDGSSKVPFPSVIESPRKRGGLSVTFGAPRHETSADHLSAPADSNRATTPRLLHTGSHAAANPASDYYGMSSSTSDRLFPGIQAATSGSGTFRLATPQITTPTDGDVPLSDRFREGQNLNTRVAAGSSPPSAKISPPTAATDGLCSGEEQHAYRRPKKSMIGLEDSYFAGALPLREASANDASRASLDRGRKDVPYSSSPPLPSPVSRERPASNSARTSFESGVRPALGCSSTSRKKPLSAAARLSSYYNDHLALHHLRHQGKQTQQIRPVQKQGQDTAMRADQ